MKTHAPYPLELQQAWAGQWLAPGYSVADDDETKALGDGPVPGMVRVRMIASATGADSVGDVMLPSALADMARDFRKGIAVIADHKMDLKDVMGKTVYGRVEGDRVLATVDLLESHELTPVILEHIEKGIPTGPSIRFRIPKDGAKLLRDSYTLEIARVETHSLDPVAIPAVFQARGSMEHLKTYLAGQPPASLPEEATMELTAENLKAVAEAVADLLKQDVAGLREEMAGLAAAFKTFEPQPLPPVMLEHVPVLPEHGTVLPLDPAEAVKHLPEDEQRALLEYRQKRDAGTQTKAVFEPTPESEADPLAPFRFSNPEDRALAEKRLRGVEVA